VGNATTFDYIGLIEDGWPDALSEMVEPGGRTTWANCILELLDAFGKETIVNARVATGVLLASFSAIGLGSSCVPPDHDPGSPARHGNSHTTLPSPLEQANCRLGTAQDAESDVHEDIQRLIADLDSEDASVRIGAARSLRKNADRAAPAVPTLLDHITDDGAIYDFELKFTVGEEAVHALKAIGEPAFVPIVQCLESNDAKMRVAAARILGQKRDRRAVVPLVATLKDPVAGVRAAAVDALGSLSDPVVLEDLMQLAIRDTTPDVLREIPWSIRRLEGDHLEELLSLMELGKPTLKRAAVSCLSQGPSDPRLVAPLLTVFREQRPQFVESYAFLFRQIYRSGGVEEVAEIVRSGEYSPSTRRWALAAMEGDPLEPELALLSLADRDRDLRLLAADRLSDLHPSGMTDRVFEILGDLDDEAYLETTRKLASYLGSTNDPRATMPLVAALFDAANKQSGYFMMPRSMIVVFGELNDPRAIDPLLERANDPSRDVRLAAIHALMQMDNPRVKEIFSHSGDLADSPLPQDLPSLMIEIKRKEQGWKKPGHRQ
jgi:HEAT repeat protein